MRKFVTSTGEEFEAHVSRFGQLQEMTTRTQDLAHVPQGRSRWCSRARSCR